MSTFSSTNARDTGTARQLEAAKATGNARLVTAYVFPAVAAGCLFAGLGLWAGIGAAYADWPWIAGTGIVLVWLLSDIAAKLRGGNFGLDLIAAMAMAGALALGSNLAAIIIALMFSGGQALESFAGRRAQREMTALLERVPRTAARYRGEGIEEIALDSIAGGDRILVRRGEVIPVDGILRSAAAVIDEAALTGEALPVRYRSGASLMSGSGNAGDAFDIEATGTAAEGTYAGVLRLVAAAQAQRAPMARLADRYAVAFLLLTVALAALAWLVSGDPVRALAVLVVATPCPLILAVPVAMVAGLSRCARNGILVKGGGALEALADAKTVLLDKTGTVTDGRARLLEAKVAEGYSATEVLRLAASLDQSSHHVVARSLVAAAKERGLELSAASHVREDPGAGISGRVDGREVVVGGWNYVKALGIDTPFDRSIETWIRRDGTVAAVVAIDGRLAGAFLLGDQVRPEAGSVFRSLRAAGIRRIVLVSGDRSDLAESVSAFLGADAFIAEAKPQEKIKAVENERAHGPVMMVGDGVNDAPALAAADVGVAMGARGAAASSESASVVILVDRLDRLVSAISIAHRSRSLALQSVYVGMGLSVVAMVAAALGYLMPIEGALLQEAIDVAVILNALRALSGPARSAFGRGRLSAEMLRELEAEHAAVGDVIDDIQVTAARIPDLPAADVGPQLARLETALIERLLPHERHDDVDVYPMLRRQGGGGALAGMSRTHMEIRRQVYALASLLRGLEGRAPDDAQQREIVRLLHGLEAITRLHFLQEEEIYRALESR